MQAVGVRWAMNRKRRGPLWEFVRRIGDLGARKAPPGKRRDDEDEGLGVLVPAGPKPRKGGASAPIPPKPR